MSLTIKSVMDAFEINKEALILVNAEHLSKKIFSEMNNQLKSLMSKTAEGNVNIQLGNILEKSEIEKKKRDALELKFPTINI